MDTTFMEGFTQYFNANKALWNKKTAVHEHSDFYELEKFKEGTTSLRSVELEEMGEVKGKSLLHLQCHFGMDTLSWAREGAEVTGMDFSDAAIAKAKELASELDIAANFVCCNVYDLPKNLEGKFDIVFTSYGTIGWLPDLDAWAKVIAHFLKPGGQFYMVDFHPFIWMHNYEMDKIDYSYFNDEVIAETTEGTYADRSADIKQAEYGWNHPISEILNALIGAGLQLEAFNEFNFSTWNCFENLEEIGHYKYQFKHLGAKIPMMYSIRARS